jgi:uncharacterized protein YndB with AHSA1/START domain
MPPNSEVKAKNGRMNGNVVSVERVIPAPPSAVFALIADAAKHALIDGSGTVKGTASAAEPLELGAEFGMSMRAGVGYRMVSRVIEFERDRRIAWQSRFAGPLGRVIGGRIWRYQLEPVEGGRTRVTESWDVSRDNQRLVLRLGGLPEKTRGNMERTLERIEEVLANPPA